MEITLSCTKMPCFVVRHVRLASNAFDFDFDFVSEVRFSIDMRYCIVRYGNYMYMSVLKLCV